MHCESMSQSPKGEQDRCDCARGQSTCLIEIAGLGRGPSHDGALVGIEDGRGRMFAAGPVLEACCAHGSSGRVSTAQVAEWPCEPVCHHPEGYLASAWDLSTRASCSVHCTLSQPHRLSVPTVHFTCDAGHNGNSLFPKEKNEGRLSATTGFTLVRSQRPCIQM
jgi:hypothetical protein